MKLHRHNISLTTTVHRMVLNENCITMGVSGPGHDVGGKTLRHFTVEIGSRMEPHWVWVLRGSRGSAKQHEKLQALIISNHATALIDSCGASLVA